MNITNPNPNFSKLYILLYNYVYTNPNLIVQNYITIYVYY